MILDRFRLDGKTALITGARRGIGRAMTVALAEAGAGIVATSAVLTPGSEVEQEVVATGRQFRAYACDLADRKAIYEFVAAVDRECPPIDILVNNAGTVRRKPAEEHP